MGQPSAQLCISNQGHPLPEPFLVKLKRLLAEVDAKASYTLLTKIKKGKSERSRNVLILETYAKSIKFIVYAKISTLSWECILGWDAKKPLMEEILNRLQGKTPSKLVVSQDPSAPKISLPRQAVLKKLPVEFMSVSMNRKLAPRFIARLLELYPDRILTKEYARALLIAEFGYKDNEGAGTAWAALVRSGYAEHLGGDVYKIHEALSGVHLPTRGRFHRLSVEEHAVLEKQLERLTDLVLFRRRGINRTELREEVRAHEADCERILKKLRNLCENT